MKIFSIFRLVTAFYLAAVYGKIVASLVEFILRASEIKKWEKTSLLPR